MFFPVVITDGVARQHVAIQLDGIFLIDIPLQHVVSAVFQCMQHDFVGKLALFRMYSHPAQDNPVCYEYANEQGCHHHQQDDL